MFMIIVAIRPSPVSHSTSGWYVKIFTSDFKKIHYFPHISWYCTIFAFCFWTGNKLLTSATTANTSQNVIWSVIELNYIE